MVLLLPLSCAVGEVSLAVLVVSRTVQAQSMVTLNRSMLCSGSVPLSHAKYRYVLARQLVCTAHMH